MPAPADVFLVRLVRVSLTLERQFTVSQFPVVHRNKSHGELDKVQQIKANYQQLFLLFPVNTLMPHNSKRNPLLVPRQDKRANRYCGIALRRQYEILYNSHNRYFLTCFRHQTPQIRISTSVKRFPIFVGYKVYILLVHIYFTPSVGCHHRRRIADRYIYIASLYAYAI